MAFDACIHEFEERIVNDTDDGNSVYGEAEGGAAEREGVDEVCRA